MKPATSPTRRPGVTLWLEIEKTLAADIHAGRLRGRLPTEPELAERFGVNRHTVRQAVKALCERGLVEVVHGRGSFVPENVIDYELGQHRRFAHSLARARRVGRSRVLESRAVEPDAEVLSLLELPEGAQVLQIDSLDVVEERVVAVCTQYLPLPRFEGFAERYAELGKTHLVLESFGVAEVDRRLGRVSARLPSRAVARQLGQPAGAPILYVESVYVDAAGLPVEYGISRFAGSLVQVLI